jgi:DNA modification methylase
MTTDEYPRGDGEDRPRGPTEGLAPAVLYCGDVRAVLATLPERSVQTCLTSPPYFGLRDYGHPGQIGLERTPEEYVANVVAVFRGVRRVLRDDGTLWLNLGDSYAGGKTGRADGDFNARTMERYGKRSASSAYVDGQPAPQQRDVPPGLKPKDLVGIPWMVAFALRADGWYLRSEIIWAKPNPMPESVTDRPTKAHEQVFLLSKSERYHYDAQAIRGPDAGSDHPRNILHRPEPSGGVMPPHAGIRKAEGGNGAGRNARSVWTIATQPFSGARLDHFAVFPEELARRCILAGSAARACEHCGAPWDRTVERERVRPAAPSGAREVRRWAEGGGESGLGGRTVAVGESWQPTCACENTGSASSVVLDPFGGSGTAAAVAVGHGRRAIYIDLNPAYLDLAEQRIGPMLCTRATPAEAA